MGVKPHTAKMMPFQMINARKTSLTDCATKMFVGIRLHNGEERLARIGEKLKGEGEEVWGKGRGGGKLEGRRRRRSYRRGTTEYYN